MSKSDNKKTLNVKAFMETETYKGLKEQLQNEINNNSIYFNTKLMWPFVMGSNLIKRHNKLKMHKQDRLALKKMKSDYKKSFKQLN